MRRIEKRQRVEPGSDEDLTIPKAAREYANLRHEEREYERRRKEVGGRLLPMMQEKSVTKEKVDFDADTIASVGIKTRDNYKIDEDKLKKALGAPLFNKLTTAKLDEDKIEAAIALGDVDPNVVAACTEHTETQYLEVRYTKKPKKKS